MGHAAFHACLAYHDHHITTAAFTHLLWPMLKFLPFVKLPQLLLLCGGA